MARNLRPTIAQRAHSYAEIRRIHLASSPHNRVHLDRPRCAPGLGAEEWRTGREHDQLARATLQSIRQEVSANRAILEKRVPYHQVLLDSVTALEQSAFEHTPTGIRIRPGTRWRTPNEMGFKNGFALTPPAATAWQAVVATNVLGYLDYRTAFTLSQAYAAQQDLRDEITAFGADFPVIFGGITGEAKPATALITPEVHLDDLLAREHEVLNLYERLETIL